MRRTRIQTKRVIKTLKSTRESESTLRIEQQQKSMFLNKEKKERKKKHSQSCFRKNSKTPLYTQENQSKEKSENTPPRRVISEGKSLRRSDRLKRDKEKSLSEHHDGNGLGNG